MSTTRLRITGGLFIDCGEGREIKHGDRAGQIRYTRQPRARYECVACRTTTETVTGAEAVKAFINHIRATHKATCTGAATEGAQAA